MLNPMPSPFYDTKTYRINCIFIEMTSLFQSIKIILSVVACPLVFHSHSLGFLWPFQCTFCWLLSVLFLSVHLWCSMENHTWANGAAPERQKFLGFYVLETSPYPMIDWGGKMKGQFLCLGVMPKSKVCFTFPISPVESGWGWNSAWLPPSLSCFPHPVFPKRTSLINRVACEFSSQGLLLRICY